MPNQIASPPQKCPYLAGRPPHGSHHTWPSGANVCFARTSEEKPYGRVSQETQAACCFAGGESYERCADFEKARERHLELPLFDGKSPAGETGAAAERLCRRARRERQKRRRRTPLRTRLATFGQSTFACLCWILLMVVAFWLVRR